MSSVSSILDSFKLPFASLLPEKLLNEKSNKIEYKAWYEKIMNYMGCCGLEEVVKIDSSVGTGKDDDNENEAKDKSGKLNKAAASLQQKSWLAYSIIVSRLSDSLVIQFSTVDKGNARMLLSAINNRFGAVNFFSKLQARRDFNHIGLRSNESISSYGARIKYAAKELELMDNLVKVSEMELISRLVDGLPKEYDSLILGLVRGIETITFDEFVMILESKCSLSKIKNSNYYNNNYNKSSSGSSNPESTVAGHKEFVNAAVFRGNCYKCGEYGHRSNNCNNSNEQNDNKSGSPKVKEIFF
ncbi:MAG: hypothetical protein ACXW07_06460 [Nitrososphaeraceae archaeon]